MKASQLDSETLRHNERVMAMRKKEQEELDNIAGWHMEDKIFQDDSDSNASSAKGAKQRHAASRMGGATRSSRNTQGADS